MPLHTDLPADLYEVCASVGVAASSAENLRFCIMVGVDPGNDISTLAISDDTAKFFAGLATQLKAQYRRAAAGFRAVETELYASSLSTNCAYSTALNFALTVKAAFLAMNDPDGTISPNLVRQKWTEVVSALRV